MIFVQDSEKQYSRNRLWKIATNTSGQCIVADDDGTFKVFDNSW